MLKQRKNKGQSFIEYVSLIILILASLIVFQKYIARGIYGRWKSAGDMLSPSTGIYDPDKTLECGYDDAYGTNAWYNTACYDQNNCYQKCIDGLGTCHGCIAGCNASMCN